MTTTRDPLALDEQVCFAVVVAARSVLSAYRPVLAPLGLTHPQYLVMLALWESSPMSLKELADRLRLDSATLSPLLKRLEAAGFVQRPRAADDERALAVGLTDAGVALRQDALAVPARIADRLDMTDAELRALHAALTRVIAAVDTAPAHSPAPSVVAG